MRRFSESPSSISTYNTCGLRYAFKYRDKLPDPAGPAAELGKRFHDAVYASWHTQNTEQEDVTVAAMLRALYQHPEVRRLPHVKLEQGRTCEYQVKVPMQDSSLFGYVDMLLDDLEYAVDLKTSGKPWTEEKVEEATQHLAYTHALRATGRSPVRKFLYIVVTTGKNPQCQVIALDVTAEACERYAKQFTRTVKSIALDLFMATPSKACNYCNFRAICPAWRQPQSPTVQRIPLDSSLAA